jgi:hypothetical protein
MKQKYIWSNRYGKNKAEGLHVWLENNIKDYQRGRLHEYIKGFSNYLQRPTKCDTVNLAQDNFLKWTQFVINNQKPNHDTPNN